MEQVHAIFPGRSDNHFDLLMNMIASGTPLRHAIDMIISAQNGALICIGDVDNVLMLGTGGFKIDTPFTPQRLFELSKMDGAIVLSGDLKRIICANFHLNPDPGIQTAETGTRHRTAARMSAQTNATVIAIPKRRMQTTFYLGGKGLVLDSDSILLSKGNQGLLATQGLKTSLERASIRLTFLELDGIVTVVDVVAILRRYCRLIDTAVETEHYINYLGNNSGLLRNQLEEMMRGIVNSFLLVIRDYAVSDAPEDAPVIARELLKKILGGHDSVAEIMSVLGHEVNFEDEDPIAPRGIRTISRISMLNEAAVTKIIDEYGSLSAIVRDSEHGFDRLENLGVDNVRDIAKSFMQLRSNL